MIDAHDIDLTVTGASALSVTYHDASFSAAGDMYVSSTVWRQGRWDREESDPAHHDVGCNLVVRYGRDGQVLDILMCGFAKPHEDPPGIPYAWGKSLCALPDGTVALSYKPDCTYVISADLSSIVAAYAIAGDTLVPDLTGASGLATRMRTTPGGRLLCVLGESCVEMYAFCLNAIAIGDPASMATTRPTLAVIATVHGVGDRVDMESDAHRPHVRYQGAPLTVRNRPFPLAEQLLHVEQTRAYFERSWSKPYIMGAAEPLPDDLFVVPLFGKALRSGNKGTPFVFCLLDDEGMLVGALQGLDLYSESPYAGNHRRVTTDPARGRVFHLNNHGLYAWDRDSTALGAKVTTAEKPYSMLKQFGLLCCSPEGEIVLVHRKQNVVLRIPAPRRLDELHVVVADARKGFGTERARAQEAPLTRQLDLDAPDSARTAPPALAERVAGRGSDVAR